MSCSGQDPQPRCSTGCCCCSCCSSPWHQPLCLLLRCSKCCFLLRPLPHRNAVAIGILHLSHDASTRFHPSSAPAAKSFPGCTCNSKACGSAKARVCGKGELLRRQPAGPLLPPPDGTGRPSAPQIRAQSRLLGPTGGCSSSADLWRSRLGPGSVAWSTPRLLRRYPVRSDCDLLLREAVNASPCFSSGSTSQRVRPVLRPAPAKETAPAKEASPLTRCKSSVRVETSKLDHLMDMVGEIVIAQSLIRHNPLLATATDSRLLGGSIATRPRDRSRCSVRR